MLKYVVLLQMVVGLGMLSGCAHDYESQWALLDDVQSVDCTKWQPTDEDLRIERMFVLDGKKPHLLIGAVARTGEPIGYVVPLDDDGDFDRDDAKLLKLGRFGQLLDSVTFNEKVLALVAQNRSSGPVIELRDVQKNVVMHTIEGLTGDIDNGRAFATKSGFWFVFEDEDSSTQIVFVPNTAKSKLTYRTVKGINIIDQPFFFVNQQSDEAFVAFRTDSQKVGTKADFTIAELFENGTNKKVGAVSLVVKDNLESWVVDRTSDGYLFAFIDGDSLVGDARLRVVGYSQSVTGTLRQAFDEEARLLDVHVSEPLIYQNNSDTQIFLLQWLDAESTVATYGLKGSKLSPRVVSGVFSTGSRIQQVAKLGPDEPFIVVRTKDELNWKFQLCRMSDL